MQGEKVKEQDIITIDGPAGAGKSTISREVARLLGYTYLDTGAMYRAVAWLVKNNGVPLDDSERICALCEDIRIFIGNEHIKVNEMDVTSRIRTPQMDILASAVSKLACVRDILSDLQRKIGAQGRIVAEGRDMGTVVFPQAKYKFFLTASTEERARRRKLQLGETGEAVQFDEIFNQIKERDKNDSERKIAPLSMAKDAMLVDSSNLSIDEVVKIILEHIKGASKNSFKIP